MNRMRTEQNREQRWSLKEKKAVKALEQLWNTEIRNPIFNLDLFKPVG